MQINSLNIQKGVIRSLNFKGIQHNCQKKIRQIMIDKTLHRKLQIE